MASRIFQPINIEALALDWLPGRLSTTITWPAIMRVILSPFQKVQDDFQKFRSEVNRDASYSPQTMVLEQLLQSKFPDQVLWVKIVNANAQLDDLFIVSQLSRPEEDVFVRNQAAILPSIEEVFIRAENTSSVASDFLIRVKLKPAQTITESAIRRIADRYKTYGTTYAVSIEV